jgi:hypothetical protein
VSNHAQPHDTDTAWRMPGLLKADMAARRASVPTVTAPCMCLTIRVGDAAAQSYMRSELRVSIPSISPKSGLQIRARTRLLASEVAFASYRHGPWLEPSWTAPAKADQLLSEFPHTGVELIDHDSKAQYTDRRPLALQTCSVPNVSSAMACLPPRRALARLSLGRDRFPRLPILVR